MAKNSQPWDLNPILEAFLKSMEGKATDENFDELSLRIKDLNGLFKDLIQFFKTQGLYNKELGDVIKKAVEFEKAQTKSRKGQGISQDTAHLYISQELSKYFALSARGKSSAFDVNSKNDLIKAMKGNLSAYDKLVTSVNDLQKTITDAVNSLGGKLGQSMGGSNKKDPSGGGFLGLLGAAIGRGNSTKDLDLKSAAPKGNPFMKGIGTLIGFLGNMGGNGFLGRLKKAISEFFVQAGLDVLRLAAYGLLSLVRNFGTKVPSILKIFKWAGNLGKLTGGKLTGKTIGFVEKWLEKKGAPKVLGKASGKGIGILGKGLGKAAGHLAGGPFSLGIGALATATRWNEGDKVGASLEALSGVLGAIPTGYTKIASLILDAILLIRDIANHFFGDKMPEILKNPYKVLTPVTTMQAAVKDMSKGLEMWQELQEKRNGERNKQIDKILDWLYNSKFGQWLMGEKGNKDKKDSPKHYSKEASALNDSDERYNKIYKKLGYLKSIRDNGEAPYLQGKTNVELANLAVKMVDKDLRLNPEQSTTSATGVSASASLNNIGAGQSYKAPSIGGSVLGDAFFGGNLSRISTGGGFGGSRGHKGIDLPYPEGTTVRAFLPGKFEYMSDNLGGFGKVIGIRDDRGMMNIYAHLSHINKNLYGKKIQRGQEIGRSGSTGYSVTGSKPGSKVEPHLHFEVRPSMAKGGSVNPVAHVASALGYSVDSLPDSGPMFADSEPSMDSSRSASAPKGVYNEEGNVVASAGEGGTPIAEELKNAYANNGFDQTGNTQFLAAINSIRVQLGKYQQIGMVTGG